MCYCIWSELCASRGSRLYGSQIPSPRANLKSTAARSSIAVQRELERPSCSLTELGMLAHKCNNPNGIIDQVNRDRFLAGFLNGRIRALPFLQPTSRPLENPLKLSKNLECAPSESSKIANRHYGPRSVSRCRAVARQCGPWDAGRSWLPPVTVAELQPLTEADMYIGLDSH